MANDMEWESAFGQMMEQNQAISTKTQNSTPPLDIIKARMLKAIADNGSVILSPQELDSLIHATTPQIPAAKDSGNHAAVISLYETLVELRKKNIPVGIKEEQLLGFKNLWEMTKSLVPGRVVFEFLLVHNHPHPLDGRMDRTQKYRDCLIYDPVGGLDYEKMGVTKEESMELVYLCCVQTIETLESRKSYFGTKVTHVELFGLWGAVSYFLRYFVSNRMSQHLKIEKKIHDGLDNKKDLWFEMWEVEALCNLCYPLTRANSTTGSEQIVPVKQPRRDFMAIVHDMTELVRVMNHNTSQAMTLNSDQMADMFSFIMMGFEEHGLRRIVGSGNSEHPQVTGLAKLEGALDRFSKSVLLSREEVTVLRKLIKDAMDKWLEKGPANCSKGAAELKTPVDMSCAVAELSSLREWMGGALQVVNSLASSVPALANDPNRSDPSRLEYSLKLLASTIKSLVKERDTAIREGDKSRKTAATKELQLKEANETIDAIRLERTGQEERLAVEVSGLRSELAATKIKLDDALAQPDKIRDKFHKKIQDLYAKGTALKDTIVEKDNEIVKKDNEIATKAKAFTKLEVRFDKYKSTGKDLKITYDTLLKENEEIKEKYEAAKMELAALKSLHPSA